MSSAAGFFIMIGLMWVAYGLCRIADAIGRHKP